MPDREILSYYEAIAPKMLSFLRGRPVAVRHHFDTGVVFRRHPTKGSSGKKSWIRIETKRDLLAIVHQHGYEFFPHLEGERDLWFALDIDIRAVPLELGKIVVQTVVDILQERRVKFLLKFSGGNGFHILWSFPLKGIPRGKWTFLRRIVRALRNETERRLQVSSYRKDFYSHLPSGDPITELNAMDKEAQTSVLFDELIIKPLATIRAPFSLHMKDRLVAVPLVSQDIEHFVPERFATPTEALKIASPRLPRNPVAPFLKAPWI